VEDQKDYRISFFKPTTPFSRTNRNLVIVLVLIWAIGVFGFQILLRIMEKPTPEKTLTVFENVWGGIQSGSASQDEKIEFANSLLMVLGKTTLTAKPDKRAVLDNALSWIVYDLMSGDSLRSSFITEMSDFEKQKAELSDLQDPDYIKAKTSIINRVAPMLGLEAYELKAKLLPHELKSDGLVEFKAENQKKLPGIMSLYLTHNRSALTDTIFLGFPFHYFYTAVFLLIMFVSLCWVYSFKIDKLHQKMGNYDKKPVANN